MAKKVVLASTSSGLFILSESRVDSLLEQESDALGEIHGEIRGF